VTSTPDVVIKASITDVRCKPATAATVCNSPTAADGPDYAGQLRGNAQIRMTDHWNGASATDTGTVVDLPFPVDVNCVNTTGTAVGGTCSVDTSLNATQPGAVPNGGGSVRTPRSRRSRSTTAVQAVSPALRTPRASERRESSSPRRARA
jgi:hypothetical protein